jgi:hypothetical protein
MLRFNLNALLCALTIGLVSMTSTAASAQRFNVQAGCHVHGKLLCCPGGCIDPRRQSVRPVTRSFCHWHGSFICCPGFGCIDVTQVQ